MKRAILFLAILALAAPAWAAEPETIVDNLTNPCGIAVQPETGDVFVADSGAGRVIRIHDGKPEDVIVGFPQDVYGKGPKYAIGPLGLAFIDKSTLVVGGGGFVDTKEVISIYSVPEQGAGPIQFDNRKVKFGPLKSTEDLKAEGNFYGVAITDSGIFASANGDDTKGWVVRAKKEGDGYGELERFIATKEAVQVDAPVPVTVMPQRGHLVVGQMGEITVPQDSLLTFYNANTGKMLMNLETGLFDVTALAYSPKGHLYATDFAWMDLTHGGLYRLDRQGEGKDQSIDAVLITKLTKPTAMAFGPDGALYVTVIGEGEMEASTGSLLKIAPGL